jgi:hypothetical protein
MTTTTYVLIFLSLGVAFIIAYFQYYFKAGPTSRVIFWLALLRFLAVFGLLLLLINPVIKRSFYEVEKPILALVGDNSASIKALGADEEALKSIQQLQNHSGLNDKYDVRAFHFDEVLKNGDSLTFEGTQSRMDKVASSLKNQFRNKRFPLVLLSDGNQTQGLDYVYAFDTNQKVHAVVLGDTTTVTDLKIQQLNVNKYAFLKNQFPVEVFLSYNGTSAITADFSIQQGAQTVYRQSVSFRPGQKSQILQLLLPAEKVGTQIYRAVINANIQEKNTYNNVKNFAVEVMDQKTEVALVSGINHPDVGALKRAIESNVQRKVTIITPQNTVDLTNYNVVIAYQPNAEFQPLWDLAQKMNLNRWVITGMQTDFGWLNSRQDIFEFKVGQQPEDYLADYQTSFNTFAHENIGFEDFPPLQHPYGSIENKQSTYNLLGARIRTISLEQPLLSLHESQGQRMAFTFGENLWKWRLQSHVNQKTFEKFDNFTDKIIQYLGTSTARKSLVVQHESFYNSGDVMEITAQFFNKNYEFDENARLTLALQNKETKATKNYDLLKGSNNYKVNFDGLSPGTYTFQVKELNTNTTYSGIFEVLDFDIEKQFVNPDFNRLQQLTLQNNGSVFIPNQLETLIQNLLEDSQFSSIQKERVQKSPLIDWIWLLIMVVSLFTIEWFLRKYHGLL